MHILFVEDDDRLQTIVIEMLAMLGHTVVMARSSERALSQFEVRRFDVLLADARLPGMSGIELAAALTQRDPDLAVLFTAGEGYLKSPPLPFPFALLAKPFYFADLRGALERLAKDRSML
ncbi:response regulator [Oxalobacteraceae bacterium OM1]|nr:response regulator [Oxalobacteraceae bacterium OM1]